MVAAIGKRIGARIALGGLDVGQKAADFGLEAFGLDRERVGERLDVGRGCAGVGGGAGHAAHGLGAGLRLAGGAVDAFGDRRDRRVCSSTVTATVDAMADISAMMR